MTNTSRAPNDKNPNNNPFAGGFGDEGPYEGSELDLLEDSEEHHGWITQYTMAQTPAFLKSLRRKYHLGEFKKARKSSTMAPTRRPKPRSAPKRRIYWSGGLTNPWSV